MEKRLKKNRGITIISLVVTIIVLLILASVSLAMVFNQNGIFKKAEQTTDKYGQAKAQETLELMLNEARIKKYESGLTEAQLTEKINTIGRELEKEDETSSKQKIIVEGYIFEIDRSTPKFVKYVGPADGIVITSIIKNNISWENLVVTGEIKIYGDGKVVSSSARVTSGSYEITGFPTTGGTFTFENLIENTDIEITATDSKERTVTKTIKVRLAEDKVGPTLSEVKVEAIGMKIKISIKAQDDNSGVKEIKYNVEPKENVTPNEGILESEEIVKIMTAEEREYTVTFTATDNADNQTTTTLTVTTKNKITVAEAKANVNSSNIEDYLGLEVEYCPLNGGTWRVFYYDGEEGYFGKANTVYLKRDWDSETILTPYEFDGYSNVTYTYRQRMQNLNPMWYNYPSSKANEVNLQNEQGASVFYRYNGTISQNIFRKYGVTSQSSVVYGSPSIEMYVRAYNIYKQDDDALVCGVRGENGYSVGTNGNLVSRTICCEHWTVRLWA